MAAPSETTIANAALTILGERRINSLEDSGKTPKLLKDRIDEVRDDVLRRHPWNFATRRAALTADVTAPVWGFSNAFTLPSDCLRLLELDNPAVLEYRIEGRKIVTDIGSPLNIEYTAQITNVVEMDSLFRGVWGAALAADVAEAITGSSTKVEEAHSIFAAKLQAARTPDGQEPSPRQVIASAWLDSREEAGGLLDRVPTGSGTPL